MSADLDEIIAGFCRRLTAVFGGKIRSVYLFGSRATGENLPTSDVDFGVIFRGTVDRTRQREARKILAEACLQCPVAVDLTILDERDLEKGVRPWRKIGRLLEGEDLLKDCPLLPASELTAFFACSGLFDVWTIRSRPETVNYPLEYPSTRGEFLGYEENGIWEGENRFRPGFNTLVSLVADIAAYRLAASVNSFSPSKHWTAAHYRELLPSDPWSDLVEGIYRLCRVRLKGGIPTDPVDRASLSNLCRSVLDLENEFMEACILGLPGFLAVDNLEIRSRMAAFVETIATKSAKHAAIIAGAKRSLSAWACPEITDSD
jgi:predicted nucleotidyltransferase